MYMECQKPMDAPAALENEGFYTDQIFFYKKKWIVEYQ